MNGEPGATSIGPGHAPGTAGLPIHMCATVYVLDRPRRRLLLVRHDRGNLAGKWLPPGGHVEPGERPDQAALREVWEETGQRVRLLDMAPPVLPRRPSAEVARLPGPLLVQEELITGVPEGPHRHLDFLFVGQVVEDRPLRSEKGRPLGWFGLDELAGLPLVDDVAVVARLLLAGAIPLPDLPGPQ